MTHVTEPNDKDNGPLVEKVELAVRLCADARLSDAQFRVACAMVFYFHNTKTGECFPSYPQLARAAFTSKRTAQRTTHKLKAMNVIDFEESNGGRNKRNSYILKTVSPAHPLKRETVSPAHPPGVTSAPLTVSPAHPHISSELTQGIKPVKGKTRQMPIGENAEITPKHIEFAATLGIDKQTARAQFQQFKDYNIGKANRQADWFATWRNWCRAHLKIVAERRGWHRPQETDERGGARYNATGYKMEEF